MNKLLKLLLAVMFAAFAFSCSEDDDSGTNSNNDTDPWVGTWLSAGTDVAPLLVSLFNYDSVRVTIGDDLTVKTESHVSGGAWSETNGTYSITENDGTSILTVEFIYAAFSQQGIMEITEGSPDQMQLEVVQTTPDIGATPRTSETGFGSDPALGVFNIQKYVREE